MHYCSKSSIHLLAIDMFAIALSFYIDMINPLFILILCVYDKSIYRVDNVTMYIVLFLLEVLIDLFQYF